VTSIRISFLKIFKIISPDQVNAVARWSAPSRIESPLKKGMNLALALKETLLSALALKETFNFS
jgi:hypothetical protein